MIHIVTIILDIEKRIDQVVSSLWKCSNKKYKCVCMHIYITYGLSTIISMVKFLVTSTKAFGKQSEIKLITTVCRRVNIEGKYGEE